MFTIDFEKLDIKPNDRILDIGCGEGRHVIKACQQKGAICVGADFGFEPLIQTQNKINFHRKFNDVNCKCVDLTRTDITKLPFKDNSFDVVICSEVLEHIPDDSKAMSELVRIVKPGKTLAVSVPRYWPERICWALADNYFDSNMGHVRIYKKNPIIKAITSLGVKLLGFHYAHSIHSPYWWLKCLVDPTRTDSIAVNLYQKLLVWDLMKRPWITGFIDRLLNPVLGKSLVMYFKKS
jgi:SAM-dependent methyltransferase